MGCGVPARKPTNAICTRWSSRSSPSSRPWSFISRRKPSCPTRCVRRSKPTRRMQWVPRGSRKPFDSAASSRPRAFSSPVPPKSTVRVIGASIRCWRVSLRVPPIPTPQAKRRPKQFFWESRRASERTWSSRGLSITLDPARRNTSSSPRSPRSSRGSPPALRRNSSSAISKRRATFSTSATLSRPISSSRGTANAARSTTSAAGRP